MNQQDIFVRPAKLADLPTLLEFEQGIITAERPYDPTLGPDPLSYYDLGALIDSDKAEVLVAEEKGKIIASGYAKILKAKAYNAHEYYSYLGFMYTIPEARGRGVNKLILEGLKEWSKQQGIYEVRLEVYQENEAAVRAYLKAGFTANLTEMRIELK